MDIESEEFGMDRLSNTLASLRGYDAKYLVDGMMSAVKDFAGNAPQSDDITILAVHVKKSGENGSDPGKYFNQG